MPYYSIVSLSFLHRKMIHVNLWRSFNIVENNEDEFFKLFRHKILALILRAYACLRQTLHLHNRPTYLYTQYIEYLAILPRDTYSKISFDFNIDFFAGFIEYIRFISSLLQLCLRLVVSWDGTCSYYQSVSIQFFMINRFICGCQENRSKYSSIL